MSEGDSTHEEEEDIKDENSFNEQPQSEGKGQEDDEDLEQMRQKIKQLQKEADTLEKLQKEMEKEMGSAYPVNNKEVDARSVFVGNVDYGSTPEELQTHFQSCGAINRVTILVDKFSGRPKGFAYIEFVDPESVPNAMAFNDSLFRGRQIKVTQKRTNVPGFKRGSSWYGGYNPYRGSPRRFYSPYARRARRPYYA
eukprot:TRINITY_DN4022_c0_g1_i4.p1 TRINITY_DN4022_c0_g1~~TRINITY_DN4022_c0_g1_i4.p1  ORF type:complete len:211 (+),score=51.86 TRINITY_DN4022_c0_g1_i4:46-633(+)